MEKVEIGGIIRDLVAIATLRQEIQVLIEELEDALREAERAEDYERCIVIRDGLAKLLG